MLRLGHRYVRDFRITTHVCLIARALGAHSVILSDVIDREVERTVKKVVELWGGPFHVEMGVPWREAINKWKAEGGIVCHLTMYGENIEASDVMARIRKTKKDVMVIIGAEKVSREVYQLADFNVAISNQPHSECGALAVFLDRYFQGKSLNKEFKNAKLRIIPQPRGKKVIRVRE